MEAGDRCCPRGRVASSVWQSSGDLVIASGVQSLYSTPLASECKHCLLKIDTSARTAILFIRSPMKVASLRRFVSFRRCCVASIRGKHFATEQSVIMVVLPLQTRRWEVAQLLSNRQTAQQRRQDLHWHSGHKWGPMTTILSSILSETKRNETKLYETIRNRTNIALTCVYEHVSDHKQTELIAAWRT